MNFDEKLTLADKMYESVEAQLDRDTLLNEIIAYLDSDTIIDCMDWIAIIYDLDNLWEGYENED